MSPPSPGRRARVALVLANAMAVRNTLQSPVLGELAGRDDLEVAFLTPSPADRQIIAAQNAPHLTWALLSRPLEGAGLSQGGPARMLARLAGRLAMRGLRPWAGFGNLVYRFNEMRGFRGHAQKKALPPERRAREAQAGNFVEPALGRPWPASRALFDLLNNLYHATWHDEPAVEAFLDQYRPDLLALHHVQFESVRPWSAGARRRGIPILGVVASWDQPTTKGPLCPGLGRVLVQSRQMRDELERHHGVPPQRVEVVGWPQMDIYLQPGVIRPRADLLAELGLGPTRRLVLLGANSARLGPHEPGIAAHLARVLAADPATQDVTLVIRPHPNDNDWEARFGGLKRPPAVLVLPAEWGRLDFLANLLAHAQVVLASAGTICLDAIALDTCTVGLGFDGDLVVPHHQSVRRWYELDHYAPVAASGGLRVVGGFDELDRAVAAYLADPNRDREGRALCRAEQLEPFDGLASRRLVQALAREAKAAAGRGGAA